MKQALCAMLLGLILSITPLLHAQERNVESEYYYVNVPIERIYAHKDGYVVSYLKGLNKIAQIYIPIEWFTDPSGKGDLVAMGSGSLWPNMTIYYKSGEFSHVRLIVRRDRRHPTWGVVPLYVDSTGYFDGVEGLYLEY